MHCLARPDTMAKAPKAGACPCRSGGCLVARHRAGFGAIPSFAHVEELGARGLASARLLGTPSGPIHGARAGKPGCERLWRRCKARFKRMRLLSSWPRRFLRSGKRGLPSGRRRFSAPRLPWKGAMGLWHSCIIISEACPGTDTRCGPFCITSIVAPQMERPPRPGFSGGRFRISLRRFYPISKSCLGLDNAMTMSRYVTDVMKCPALRGYPSGDFAAGDTSVDSAGELLQVSYENHREIQPGILEVS